MTLERLAEARSILELACSTSQALVADYPNVLTYRIALALSLANLGSLEMKLENFDKSAQQLNEAIGHLEPVVAKLPNIKTYRRYLIEDYQLLAQAYSRQSLFPKAIAAAEKILELEPLTAESQLAAAVALAVVLKDVEQPGSQTEQPARRPSNPATKLNRSRPSPANLEDRVLDLLTTAVAAEPKLRDRLQNPVFDRLKTDARFPSAVASD